MKERERKIFSLNLICFLRLNGFKEESVRFNEKTKKVYFVYIEDEKLSEAIREYKNTDTLVNLHGFIGEFRALKEEMYQHLKSFMKK